MAMIDPSIALQVRPAQVADPLEAYGRVLGIQGARQQQQMQAMQMQEAQRQLSEEQALRDQFKGGARPTAEALIGAAGSRGATVAKQLGELDKAGLEERKAKLDFALSQNSAIATMLKARAKDQASYEDVLVDLKQIGAPVERMSPKYDPQIIDGYIKNGLTVAQQLQEHRAEVEAAYRAAEEQRKAGEFQMKQELHPSQVAAAQQDAIIKQQTATGTQKIQPAQQATIDAQKKAAEATNEYRKAQLALTARGQNMTDARAREMATITRDTKPPTEAELRNYGFFTRAADAEAALGNVEKEISGQGVLASGYRKLAPNAIQTESNQAFEQARRQFIEAYLRRDSGAAIAPTEYANADKTFFPQPGDSQSVLKQKQAARKRVIETLKVSAGRAEKQNPYAAPAAPDSPVTSGVPSVGGTFNGEKVLKVTRIQ